MKTIKFTGDRPLSFGVAGTFHPGQESTIDAQTADRLIAKGYFSEVKTKKQKNIEYETDQ